MRGEYEALTAAHMTPEELPPRARRIRRIDFISPIGDGTTSACAENTE